MYVILTIDSTSVGAPSVYNLCNMRGNNSWGVSGAQESATAGTDSVNVCVQLCMCANTCSVEIEQRPIAEFAGPSN